MELKVKISSLPTGGYKASCPSLPGCCIMAASRRQALSRIKRAVSGYLAHIDEILPRELGRLSRFNRFGAN